MSVVLGNISLIMTKFLSIDIAAAPHWDYYIKISQESKEQINFWYNELESLNYKRLFVQPSSTRVVYSDASSYAFGGYEVNTPHSIAHGTWSPDETSRSSTWRELTAVVRVLKSLAHVLRGNRVKWFTDNQSVSRIVPKGSMVQDLQHIAYDIYRYCVQNSVTIEMEWIPRSQNEMSDYLSKIVDHDDWGISFKILNMLHDKWGVLQIDWFASDHNAKLPTYWSRFWNEGCAGVDAFSESWSCTLGLFVPPISIISRVIHKMIQDKARGVLIVPQWFSAPFWPILCPRGCFRQEVVDHIVLPTQIDFYNKCKNGRGIFGNQDLPFNMLALKIAF
jgi:hypothetical protein